MPKWVTSLSNSGRKKTVKEANVSILMCNSNFRLGNKKYPSIEFSRIFSVKLNLHGRRFFDFFVALFLCLIHNLVKGKAAKINKT